MESALHKRKRELREITNARYREQRPKRTPRTRKSRKSPAGVILCEHGHITSRGRFNAALRLGLRPQCKEKECRSVDLQPQPNPGCGWEIRGGVNKHSLAGFGKGGLRFVWTRVPTVEAR